MSSKNIKSLTRNRSPRLSKTQSKRTSKTLSKRTSKTQSKRRTRGIKSYSKNTANPSSDEFNMLEFFINTQFDIDKIKLYLDKHVDKKHPLYKIKQFTFETISKGKSKSTGSSKFLKKVIELYEGMYKNINKKFKQSKSKLPKKGEIKKTYNILYNALIEKLKTFINSPMFGGANTQETCMICLEKIDNTGDNPDSSDTKYFGENCSHYNMFHKKCIHAWIIASEAADDDNAFDRSRCPLCARPIIAEYRNEILQNEVDNRINMVVQNERRRLRRRGLDFLLCSAMLFIVILKYAYQLNDDRLRIRTGHSELVSWGNANWHRRPAADDDFTRQELEMWHQYRDIMRGQPVLGSGELITLLYHICFLSALSLPFIGVYDIYSSFTLRYNEEMEWGDVLFQEE